MELKYLLNYINSSHHNVEEYYNFLFPILYYNNEIFIKSDFLNSTIKCSYNYKNNYNKTDIIKKEKYDYNLSEKYNYNLDKEYNFLFNE